MAIQISMAPAFLLVAISNLINGTTATRQRIIDRYRQLTAEKSDVLIRSDEVEYEKSVLRHRVSLLTRSIILLTSAIMLIALVIFIIFISLVSPQIDLTLSLAPLFAVAMLSVIVASVFSLWQLRVSSKQLRRIGLSS
jgi:membrane-associated HD superfamily phosphohydrolase|tara:strand:- start:838 stop:1251 length:414 start_codon:yes stop_codon:yes gene_type:complete